MQKRYRFLLVGFVSVMGLAVFSTPVAAKTVVFNQTQSSQIKVTSNCTNGECTAESSVSVSQHQLQSDAPHFDSSEDTWWSPWWRHSHHSARSGDVNVRTHRSGEVALSWSWRSGTCEVRYTESNVSHYKYSTLVACNQGGVTIGGLMPGKSYRFQIRNTEHEWWTTPVTITAQ